MKQKIMKNWTRGLRSGKYAQTTGGLCKVTPKGRVKGYCCLGVMSEQAAQAKVIKRPKRGVNNWKVFAGEAGMLPRAVLEWAGMGWNGPE